MKQIYNWCSSVKGLCSLSTVILVVMAMACSDMDDLHQPFLDRGEITYAAKVDSVIARTGNSRIQFDLVIQSQRIKTVRIFWNDYKDPGADLIRFRDSSDVEIAGKGLIRKILNDMPERSYIFKLVSFDEFGNQSLPTEVHAYVYGPKYEKLLVARSMRSTMVDKVGNLRINWGVADGAYGSEVRYTDVSGKVKSHIFPIIQDTPPVSLITDIKGDTPFEYRTVYRPDTTGIDNFNTPYVRVDPPFAFDKTEWTIKDKSTNHDGNDNKVENFIDGTEATRWHSKAGGGSSYPHYASIDMGSVRTVTTVGLWITTFETPGGDQRAPNRIQFLISMDNVTWTDLGEFDFNRMLLGEQRFVMPAGAQGQYLKFVAVSGPVNDQMVMGEISAYGF